MKKVLIMTFFVFLLAGGAIANEAVQKGFISVNTEAVEELDPTIVKLSFGIETKASNVNEASENNKKTSEKAINAVKGYVDASKGETIKTTSYNLNPEYSYKDGNQKLIGYRASNILLVTLKDTSKAGKVISTALSNGANSINNIQFILDETNDECNKLIQKASLSAKQRAEKVASSMGTTITGIKYITTGCSTNQSFHSNYRFLAKSNGADAAMSANEASMPVEAGKSQLRAFVNAEFYVK